MSGENNPLNPARPDVYTQTLKDNNIWSIELVVPLSEEDLRVAASITSKTSLYSPSLGEVEQLARLARGGKLSQFALLSLHTDLSTVPGRALVSLLSLPRTLVVLPGAVLSEDQLALLAMGSKGEGWRVEHLYIASSSKCGAEASKAPC